jgi:4-aminobutyrate aminotransferase-like enzyme
MALDLHRFESPNVTYVALDFPVFWEKAAGCWVTDVDGNTYLDMTAAFGVAAVGHSNPKVVAAIKKQSERLIHGMGDVHPSDVKVRLCERISNHVTPKNSTEQWQVILGQNGSDAVEAALKTARLATGKPGIIAFTGGYHGLSYGALNVTARSDFRSPFSDQLGSFVRHLPYGCDIDMLNEEIAGNNIGAVIVEPIQGRGGIVVPPRGWLAAVAACARSHGALFICDEIFTGWGRTGNWFAHRY